MLPLRELREHERVFVVSAMLDVPVNYSALNAARREGYWLTSHKAPCALVLGSLRNPTVLEFELPKRFSFTLESPN